MYRIRIRPFFLLCLLCGLLSSCLEDIDLDTGERILGVHCVLEDGPEQELELSYIAPTGGTSSPVGEDVTITLFESGIPVGVFTRTSETKWRMDYSPEGGHTYRLEVKVPGEEPLTAETRFPSAIEIRTASAGRVEDVGSGGNPIFASGYEVISSEDQFLWCYVTGIAYPAVAGYLASEHPGVDRRGETIYPLDWYSPVYTKQFGEEGPSAHPHLGSMFPDELLEGQVFFHEKVLRILHPADFSWPADPEKYRLSHWEFDGEQYSRVNNKSGKTGLFCISMVDVSSFILCSVSAEYDRYLCDFYYGNPETGDFTTLVYKRNHYSNVLNGTGIFGASTEYYRVSFNGSHGRGTYNPKYHHNLYL